VFAAERGSPVALIAIWLVVLQAFLAGVAMARAGGTLGSAFSDVPICHGADDGRADSPALPADAGLHLCCACCMSAAPPLLSPNASAALALTPGRASRLLAFPDLTLIMAHSAVRAGLSQAPPSDA
jgi:hypothetical protein